MVKLIDCQLGETEWLVYSSRAYCELAQNKFSEAIADYKIYIAQVPTDTFAGYNLGLAYGHRGDTYYDAGKYALAIADYKVVASLIKGDAHSSCQLVYSYFALKNYQSTIDAGKAATDIKASCGGQKLVDVEGQSAYFLGDYQGAIDFMTQALKLGTDSNAYYYRGISYQATGKNKEAIQDLQIFISLVKTGSQADDAKARLAQLKQ